jgi:hypothetical protein
MYLKVEQKIIDRLKEISITDFEEVGTLIPAESIECIIEELIMEIDRLEEKVEDLKEYKEQYCDLYNR